MQRFSVSQWEVHISLCEQSLTREFLCVCVQVCAGALTRANSVELSTFSSSSQSPETGFFITCMFRGGGNQDLQRQLFCLPTFTQGRNELKSNQICQPPRHPGASAKITVLESAGIQTEAGEGSP